MPGPTATATRERVVALRQEGYKQTDIAEVLGISQSAVSKILKRQREAGNVRPRKSPGRPRLTTRRDDRQLLNFSHRKPEIALEPSSSIVEEISWDQRFPVNR